LAAQTERIKGTPFGQELLEIQNSLNAEVQMMGGHTASAPLGGSAAAPQYVLDTTGWTHVELRTCIARLMEERDELRHALQGALLEAVQREEALRAECEALRQSLRGVTKTGRTRPGASDGSGVGAFIGAGDHKIDVIQVALEEEARAAREARSDLQDDIARLKGELTAEQATSRSVRAELAAVRALKGVAGARGNRTVPIADVVRQSPPEVTSDDRVISSVARAISSTAPAPHDVLVHMNELVGSLPAPFHQHLRDCSQK